MQEHWHISGPLHSSTPLAPTKLLQQTLLGRRVALSGLTQLWHLQPNFGHDPRAGFIANNLISFTSAGSYVTGRKIIPPEQ